MSDVKGTVEVRTIAPEENWPRIIAHRKIALWMIVPQIIAPRIIAPRSIAPWVIAPGQLPQR